MKQKNESQKPQTIWGTLLWSFVLALILSVLLLLFAFLIGFACLPIILFTGSNEWLLPLPWLSYFGAAFGISFLVFTVIGFTFRRS